MMQSSLSAVNVLVADDHPVTRTGTVAILQRDPALRVIAEAQDGEEALEHYRMLHPAVVLLDVRLPKVEGLVVLQRLRASKSPPHILMLSAFSDAVLVNAAFDAGASGYVLKSVAGVELLEAIHRVLRGERVLLGIKEEPESRPTPLSAREVVVLQYVAEGLCTKDIASRLSSSTRTVETHLSRIFRKLGVTTRTQAVAIARHKHLLSLD